MLPPVSLPKEILYSPFLAEYKRLIDERMAEEARKREDFYEWVTPTQKAEFIHGEIVMHSPVKIEHNRYAGLLFRLLSVYSDLYLNGYVGFDKIMVHLTRNSYEPDLCFFLPDKAQHFTPEQMLFPAPDFIIEILSPSKEKIDRGVKMKDYAAHGVQEYWLVNPKNRTIEAYHLQADMTFWKGYTFGMEQFIQSKVVQGFRIPVGAVFHQEINMKVLTQIMAGEPLVAQSEA